MTLILKTDLELQNLKLFDNIKQLEILNNEVAYIVTNGINPLEEWYDDRFEYIVTYSKLGWKDLAERFNLKDKYIFDTALLIIQLIGRLLEERAIKRFFYIPTYHTLLYNIKNIWEYYNMTYVCGEADIDVVDLIEGMAYL
jgi:hypothetical protein